MLYLPQEIAIFGPFGGSLRDNGETLSLLRPGMPVVDSETGETNTPYIAVDRVRYDNREPWPSEADGFGPSLERINPSGYGDDAINWRASLGSASPGLNNDGNRVPTVDAGDAVNVVVGIYPTPIELNASVQDDGLPNPPAELSVVWTQISGPEQIEFSDPHTLNPTITIPDEGTWILKLTVNDGEFSASDEVAITTTFSMLGLFEAVAGTRFIEVEDFNYTDAAGNPGQWQINGVDKPNGGPYGEPYDGGAYDGLGATQGIDFFETGNNPSSDASKAYRFRAIEQDNRGNSTNGTGPAPEMIEFNGTGNADRGAFTVSSNYKIGWAGVGDWYNFTRDFPENETEYNVFAHVSAGGDQTNPSLHPRTRIGWVENPLVADSNVEWIGEFSGQGSGDWSTGAFYRAHEEGNSGIPVTVTASGVKTVRWEMTGGVLDFNYLAFVPVSNVSDEEITLTISLLEGGLVQISWQGGGKLKSSPNVEEPYEVVADQSNPYTVESGVTVFFVIEP